MSKLNQKLLALKNESASIFVNDARLKDKSLHELDLKKLLISAKYILLILNRRMVVPQIYARDNKISTSALEKNVKQLLKARGFRWKQFKAIRKHHALTTKEEFTVIGDPEGEVSIKSNGLWGRHLQRLNPHQIKLALLKAMINKVAPLIPPLLLGDEPEEGIEPVSKFTNHVFKRLTKALRYEQDQGLLPPSRDRNMQSLIDAGNKALVFISEKDNYYRVWLAYFYTIIWEEMQELYDHFSYKALKSMEKQIRFINKEKTFNLQTMFNDPVAKKMLFYWYMSKHLPFLPGRDVEVRREPNEKI